ncbi:hypothetical protein A3H22_03385 [Candidatus Peribacteria bacterium RIFCSPLOWO2_12_FULL_55_15]|nr:MAG: hypothetical protein A3H90_00990 [Candidatus Peribacteria bacterium RIFCSPLOWO2_02_FULL_55_36]OGJ72315.1 MAG: hypothetical protein A3H22_03385 [Candidatus Peribacteria bacterium RIFCSPLOWO2_12_FULL_55_15]
MAFLYLRSDSAATNATLHESDEWEIVFAPALLLSSVRHHPLHFVEQVFGNEWLVFSFIELATELQHPVIGGTPENLLDGGEVEGIPFSTS